MSRPLHRGISGVKIPDSNHDLRVSQSKDKADKKDFDRRASSDHTWGVTTISAWVEVNLASVNSHIARVCHRRLETAPTRRHESVPDTRVIAPNTRNVPVTGAST